MVLEYLRDIFNWLLGRPAQNNMSSEVNYEQALDLTGFGIYNVKLFAICFYLLMSAITEIFGQSFVVTACYCDLQMTTATKGTVVAMPMLGIVLSAHLWGWVADTKGRRKVMIYSLTGAWIVSLFSCMSFVWPMLAVTTFMTAFFVSASNSICYALVSECTPQKHRNILMLMLANGLYLGQIFNTVLAYIILGMNFNYKIPILNILYRPWRLLELVYGVMPGIGVLLLVFVIKESPKFYISRGMPEESIKVLRQIYHQNTKKKVEEYPVTVISFEEKVVTDKKVGILKSWWQQTTPMFRSPLLKNTMVIVYTVMIVYTVTPSLMMWMPSIARSFSDAMKANENYCNFCQLLRKGMQISNVTTLRRAGDEIQCVDTVSEIIYVIMPLFSGTIIVLNCFCAFLLKYISKRIMTVCILSITGLCGLLAQIIPHSFTCIMLFFMFLTNVLCMGLTSSFAVEVYPTYLKAMAVCLTMMIGRGVSFIFINLAGMLIVNYCEATFYSLSLIVISGALISMFLPNDK